MIRDEAEVRYAIRIRALLAIDIISESEAISLYDMLMSKDDESHQLARTLIDEYNANWSEFKRVKSEN